MDGAVGVSGITRLQALFQHPSADVRAVLHPERGLLLHTPEAEHQVLFRRFVIVYILCHAVVQIIVPDEEVLRMSAGIMLVGGSQGVGVLMDDGQIAEQELRSIAFLVGVQLHSVDASQAQKHHFVLVREARFHLELGIDVVGQEGQAQEIEKVLQIRLPDGEQIGGAGREMSASAQRSLGRSQGGLEVLTLGIAIVQMDVHHRTQCARAVGREGARIEVDFAH